MRLFAVALTTATFLLLGLSAFAVTPPGSQARYVIFLVPGGLERQAASTWACGERFTPEEVCFHAPDGGYPPSVLELAQAQGLSTGLVTEASLTGATPAAFGAHVPSRRCEKEIARQYVHKRMDVLLGGGHAVLSSQPADACGTAGNLLPHAAAAGYTVVYDKAALTRAVEARSPRLLGLFDRKQAPEEPSLTSEPPERPVPPGLRLPDMTRAALASLEANPRGFFLLVEAAAESEDKQSFEGAVQAVRQWLEAEPGRKARTLLIIASEVHVWGQGPADARLGQALESTELYGVMRDAVRSRQAPE